MTARNCFLSIHLGYDAMSIATLQLSLNLQLLCVQAQAEVGTAEDNMRHG